jgi:hypothetical protein
MFVINQDISVIVCNAKSRESFMRLLAILLCACIYGLSAQAHSGGLNSSGCHAGSKPYHCHRAASEMTKSSSGGYRLKCSQGSRSTDCNVPSEVGDGLSTQTEIVTGSENKADSNVSNPVIVSSVSTDVKMFGVSFEIKIDQMKAILAKRFECDFSFFSTSDWWICETAQKGWPIVISVDELDRPSSIRYTCETFDGCGYSQSEIYQYASGQFALHTGYVGNEEFCGIARSGEEVCVWEDGDIIIYRHKYGSAGLKFD